MRGQPDEAERAGAARDFSAGKKPAHLETVGVKDSVLGVVRPLDHTPDALTAFLADGQEIVSHGYRRINYQTVDERSSQRRSDWPSSASPD
jgi:hypothetical protein